MMELSQFGKDHWSTFGYAETCCVDARGVLDIRRLRVNEGKRAIRSNGLGWDTGWATHIHDGTIPDPNHDDIDCLDDLEAAGLLVQVGTLVNPVVRLTDEGKRVAAALRSHKMDGNFFSTFRYTKADDPPKEKGLFTKLMEEGLGK